VKVSVVSPLVQVPVVVGESAGSGDVGESAAEKVKTIGPVPLMPLDLSIGASEVSCSAVAAA
jgi:hypothetical protein